MFSHFRETDSSVSIHQRNLQNVALEMFKVKSSLALEIMAELFISNNSYYNLRNMSGFKRFNTKSVLYGTWTILSLGLKIRNLVPPDNKKYHINNRM